MTQPDTEVVGHTTVHFGRGASGLLRDLSTQRLLIVTTERGRTAAEVALDGALADAVFHEDVVQHVPERTVTHALDVANSARPDTVVAFGGGSTIGLAKAIAAHRSLRRIYVPTTYSGSEMTNIWAVTRQDGKTTQRDDAVRADVVIYDPDLFESLPTHVVFPSLFNSMAHAVEAMYAPEHGDHVESAERALGSLSTAISDWGSDAALDAAVYGAYQSAVALDRASMGIHHKVAHVLGGLLNVEHSLGHTVMLPYSLNFNRDAIGVAYAAMSQALGDDAVRQIIALQRQTGVPMSLRELGVDASRIPDVVDAVMQRQYANPRPVDEAGVRAMLEDAYEGRLRGLT